jgi:hypothetical protein
MAALVVGQEILAILVAPVTLAAKVPVVRGVLQLVSRLPP